MRGDLTDRPSPGDAAITSIRISRDVLELIDRSAAHSGLSRSAEISRLVIVAFENARCNSEPEAGEIIGHIL